MPHSATDSDRGEDTSRDIIWNVGVLMIQNRMLE
jgi:hypothetical protein